MKKKTFDPRDLLLEFDDFLNQRRVRFSAVVIGSGGFGHFGFYPKAHCGYRYFGSRNSRNNIGLGRGI